MSNLPMTQDTDTRREAFEAGRKLWLAGRRKGSDVELRAHRVECSWCNTVIHEGEKPASHSICTDCRDEHFPDLAL